MKKIFLISGFFCLCFLCTASAQTAADPNANGTPVSASRDAVISGTATIDKADSTGTTIPQEKNSQGVMVAEPANKQSAGSEKLSSDKKPN